MTKGLLKDEGIVANTETYSIFNEKRRKIDSENRKGWGHDMEKTNLAATPTARKDGSRWTPSRPTGEIARGETESKRS